VPYSRKGPYSLLPGELSEGTPAYSSSCLVSRLNCPGLTVTGSDWHCGFDCGRDCDCD